MLDFALPPPLYVPERPAIIAERPRIITPEGARSYRIEEGFFPLAARKVGGGGLALVGSSIATGNSIPIPSHKTGDVLVVMAYRLTSSTAPTLPAGWTNAQAGGADNVAVRMAYKTATSAAEVSGTWTNATGLIALVFRGAAVGSTAMTTEKGATTTWPGLALQDASGKSTVLMFGVEDLGVPQVPSGTTSIQSNTRARAVVAEKQSSWASRNTAATNGNAVWRTASMELKVPT